MKNKKSITYQALLIIGIVIIINILSDKYFLRLDFTADKQYTLSKATKDILEDLPETITITAYFTDDLPPELANVRRDFKDLLIEYANASDDNVLYEFVDPATDPQKEQKAMQEGIQPAIISVRQKDQVKQQKVFVVGEPQVGKTALYSAINTGRYVRLFIEGCI